MKDTIEDFLKKGGVLDILEADRRITRDKLDSVMVTLGISKTGSVWDAKSKNWLRGEVFKAFRMKINNQTNESKAYQKVIMVTIAFAKAGFKVP